LNEIVIDAILLTDAVNITLSDYMEHEVDMTNVLSADDNGDRDADMQRDSGALHPSMIALMVLGLATLVIVVILLLNLLIAMINQTYQTVQNNSDIEWKFLNALVTREFEDTSCMVTCETSCDLFLFLTLGGTLFLVYQRVL